MGIMIDGVELTPLKIISVDGGDVMHALKCNDKGYVGFGEAYFSHLKHGVVKGWKRHREMHMNLIVPVGEVRFVVYDGREASSTFGLFDDVILSRESNYQRLTIHPELWVAFQGRNYDGSMLMNIASIPHDPAESDIKDLNEIEYNWELI